MTAHEQRILTEALQAEAESRREAMRKQEQAFGAVVCLCCAIIIAVVVGSAAGRYIGQQFVKARQAQQEVRK
jgi:hypothetical protein